MRENDHREGSKMSEPEGKEDILRKIRGLLANAEDQSNTEEARRAFMDKAQQLMAKYQIDQAMLAMSQLGRKREVTYKRITVDGAHAYARGTMLFAIARNNGCKAVVH